MTKISSDLPEWAFEVDEVSANVYEVVGTDSLGHKVSSMGVDLGEVIDECKKKAKEINK